MKKNGTRNPELGRIRAFTLVELLVVIAIIGILAAMLLPVLSAAKKHALITKAKTEEADLVNSINAYEADYSRFPLIKSEQTQAGSGDFTVGLTFGNGNGTSYNGTGLSYTSNSNLVAILMDLQKYPGPTGDDTSNTNHMYNPKQVKYLNAKFSGYNPNTDPTGLNALGGVDDNGIYRDPWGNPYIITMNTSYNEQGTSDLLYSLQSVSQENGASGYNGLFNPTYNTNPNNFLFHGKIMVWSAGPDKKYNYQQKSNVGDNKDNVISW